MWKELKKNHSDFILHQDNTSQTALGSPPWTPTALDQNTGTTVAPWPSQTEKPLEPGSGIVPGMTASAIFIGFVLVVYALLWKCMVSPPRRKKKRKRIVTRDQRSLMC